MEEKPFLNRLYTNKIESTLIKVGQLLLLNVLNSQKFLKMWDTFIHIKIDVLKFHVYKTLCFCKSWIRSN